ncbi:MAG: hypothetical protein ACM3L6_05930 [Deltaproteobacteria bacterium]
MKGYRTRILVIAALFLFLHAPVFASPADENPPEAQDTATYQSNRVIKTVGGLRFDVEEDRPIEKVDGTYRPVSVDTYVAIKFQKLRQEIGQRLDALTERLDRLEEAVARLENRPVPPDGNGAAQAPASPPADQAS